MKPDKTIEASQDNTTLKDLDNDTLLSKMVLAYYRMADLQMRASHKLSEAANKDYLEFRHEVLARLTDPTGKKL